MNDSDLIRDYNEFTMAHPEADMELKIPAILKNMRLQCLKK